MPRIDLIQIRGGTAAEWTSVNPTLAVREIGYETDTFQIKFGDGTTAWTSLDYATYSASQVDTLIAGVSADGYEERTDFPGSPATHRKVYRTDRNILYVYDGTRWLSAQLFTLSLPGIVNVTASTNGTPVAYPFPGVYDIWVEDVAVAHTLSATGNWTLGLNKHTDTTATSIGSTTVTNTGSSYDSSVITIDAVVASTVNLFFLYLTENSGSASAFAHGVVLYRLIG